MKHWIMNLHHDWEEDFFTKIFMLAHNSIQPSSGFFLRLFNLKQVKVASLPSVFSMVFENILVVSGKIFLLQV
eukprot:CAMPEP_0205817208 /NCGR_PEP_ID=MMETSP0205-20121125/23937_1 /ASSEMBLY_ACC=CAM_ASM_000278 /TAXON_ID=36767 /ORGANISM="Euplotes focardii, Strain TN1" /LENGTH=72 /DNA_ID=CAMNT_0053107207 /DNA_START=156 /DNA_END=374 /DNA_ORIENTATION=-